MTRSRRAPPPVPTVRQRWSALVVALLWCASPVLAGVHGTLEVHRFCGEHGAVEDAGRAAPAEAGMVPSSGAAAHPSAGLAPGSRQSEPPASHHGCAFGEFCSLGQPSTGATPELTGHLAVRPVSPPIEPRPSTPPIAVIVVAPKTSPPA